MNEDTGFADNMNPRKIMILMDERIRNEQGKIIIFYKNKCKVLEVGPKHPHGILRAYWIKKFKSFPWLWARESAASWWSCIGIDAGLGCVNGDITSEEDAGPAQGYTSQTTGGKSHSSLGTTFK